MTVVCGVDLAAGRGITEVALLMLPPDIGPPRFDIARHQQVNTDGEIVAAIRATTPAAIAIDAPLSLPAAVAAALRGEPPPEGSAYLRAAERDPIWSRLGIRPLPVSFLGGLTFRALVLRARLAAALPHAAIVETFPAGVLRALGITSASTSPRGKGAEGARRLKKTAPDARAQTQRALGAWIAGLPSAEPEPLGADLLDALGAALTAVAYIHGACYTAGDAGEGTILLPDREALATVLGRA